VAGAPSNGSAGAAQERSANDEIPQRLTDALAVGEDAGEPDDEAGRAA
jgi:hypothetical protein